MCRFIGNGGLARRTERRHDGPLASLVGYLLTAVCGFSLFVGSGTFANENGADEVGANETGDSSILQAQHNSALVIADPWVRAMPPGRPMTAGYLRVENTSSEPVRITGVASSVGNASLHETRTVEGKSSMRPVEELLIKPGDTLELAPGGLHIMLMGLKATPREGELVPLCLTTSAGETCTDATVRRSAPSAQRVTDHSEH